MLAALASGCGGVVDNGDSGSPGDGSAPSDSGTIDTGEPGCTGQWLDAGAICGTKEVQLSGDCHVTNDAGAVPASTCEGICGNNQTFCQFNPSDNILMCGGVCIGRMPQGVVLDDGPVQNVGELLARCAYMEAAAVEAFHILARELQHHGAPAALRRSIERAARDEVRHAAVMTELATAFGGKPDSPRVEERAVRPLVDIAVENAIEGCVRETFGALVAMWQAEHARDERVRAAMRDIARDEARHAALGWRLHEWTTDMLGPEDCARVRAAMHSAVRDLERSAEEQPRIDVAEALGLPTAAQALGFVRALRTELWS